MSVLIISMVQLSTPRGAPAFRLASVLEPGASRVDPTLLCYTAVVLRAQGAYTGTAASFACLCRHCVLY
jgi:hypothetical protein